MAVQLDGQLLIQRERKWLKHRSLAIAPSPVFPTVLTTFAIIEKPLRLPQ